MSAHLQEQIKTRMESKQLSIYALEKRAGLKRNSVRNIMRGFSKKPNAETLMIIAEALDCSIGDLVGPLEHSVSNVVTNKIKPIAKSNYAWNEKLYIDAVKIISKCISDRTLHLKSDQVMSLVNEIYKYALNKNSEKIDQDFTKWLVSKY